MHSYEKFISLNDIEKIHHESLHILQEIGIRFEHPQIIEIFKKHGMQIDGNTVFFDEKTLAKYLALIPKCFTIRSSKGDSVYGKGICHKMPAAGNIYIQDNGTVRKMTNTDVINQFKLSDTSDLTDTNYMNIFLENKDFTKEQRIYAELAMHLKYSNKAGPYVLPNTFQIDNIHDSYVKGLRLIKNFEAIQNDYVCIISINTLSPLCYDHDPLEKMLIAGEENQPIWISPCAMPLLTAPPSVMSMMAMTNAETLAGLVLSQMIKPGLPCVYGNTSGSTNLKTIQLSIGSPESVLVTYVTKALADFYGLPCRAGGALSDSKDFDFQAGGESMMMIYASLDANPDLLFHACGIIGSFNIVSFEKFLADEEMYHMCSRILNGVDCSPEKECFDLISKTGPRGIFLKGRTPKIYRDEFFMPKLFNKDDPNQWQQHGSVSLRDSIQKKVEQRILSYQPPEITQEQSSLLKPYLPQKYIEKI
ncbi:trimethylamine methyltransferase family protein [Eubacterium sp. 1001713B170207_170306_E7]|uniref:trimethylamine methyltransferase family protein n=1 Tax=Eubacterium sp. 1001713B170207_170306_E7 TaxID=2787097 RepID=UPI0018974BE4|nr:trimethylamine methyltransferase family protein [Eubacterium sp. 1001713B170207_170306_E7]